MEKLIIKIGDEQELLVKVDLTGEDEEFDVDRILQIDYNNLLADIATFPVILNRLGLLLAEMDNKVREAELQLRTYKAKERKKIRDRLIAKKQKLTIDTVDDELRSSAGYVVRYSKVFKRMKERDYVNSIYWAAKSKGDNLTKLSLTIQAGDIDLEDIVKRFNGVELRTFDKTIV